jgi:hypothetical protein
MGSTPISYKPILSGEHTRGRSCITRSASARPLTDNGGAAGILRRCTSGDQRHQAAVDNVRSILKRCRTAPGYVSFDDVLHEAFGRRGRSRSAQLLARLQAGGSAYEPPLGHTRRGSFMHRLVRRYLSPCLDFHSCAFHGGS